MFGGGQRAGSRHTKWLADTHLCHADDDDFEAAPSDLETSSGGSGSESPDEESAAADEPASEDEGDSAGDADGLSGEPIGAVAHWS
jgi:hypothetical protein